jgi:hypothetical protein
MERIYVVNGPIHTQIEEVYYKRLWLINNLDLILRELEYHRIFNEEEELPSYVVTIRDRE